HRHAASRRAEGGCRDGGAKLTSRARRRAIFINSPARSAHYCSPKLDGPSEARHQDLAMPGTSSRTPRRFSLRKLALAGAAGAAMAFAIAQRPLTAPLPDTIEIADMTWVEVRSAIARGYTTVIVPSGGIEQNGPHMILGKHDLIVRFA